MTRDKTNQNLKEFEAKMESLKEIYQNEIFYANPQKRWGWV